MQKFLSLCRLLTPVLLSVDLSPGGGGGGIEANVLVFGNDHPEVLHVKEDIYDMCKACYVIIQGQRKRILSILNVNVVKSKGPIAC